MTARDDRGSKQKAGDNVVSLPGALQDHAVPDDDPRLPPEWVEPAFGPHGERWILSDGSAEIELTGDQMKELAEWYIASLTVGDLS